MTLAPFARGAVTFLVHSTFVGAITGRAPVAQAGFTGSDLGQVRGWAVVRVADMQTGNRTRDRHLREALEADSAATIRFDLDSVASASRRGDSLDVTLAGRLTVHGVTRAVDASGVLVLTPGGEDVNATFALDMRDYGVKPPVRAVVLRVSPQVTVTVHLAFELAPSP